MPNLIGAGQKKRRGRRYPATAHTDQKGEGPTAVTARQKRRAGRRHHCQKEAALFIRQEGGKVHLDMDTATSDIRAVEFTPSNDSDSPVLPELPDKIPAGDQIGTVTADSACNTRRCHTAIIDRQANAIIPIRKTARSWKEDCPAARAWNETLRATRHYGKTFWQRWTGYHARRRIKANPFMVCKPTIAGQRMRCPKFFGESITARDPDRQTAEIQIRIALMNRFNALGTAEIVRLA